MTFDNIEYLQQGNHRQRQAYATLTNHQILSKLKSFDPVLVGTIPINIDIESSDLDIICCFANQQDFRDTIADNFRNERLYHIRELQETATSAVVANFFVDDFEIEIFGQSIPTKRQYAYRHLVIEHNLIKKYGEKFRQKIVELKRQGHKTEPAFALALGLTGDPYMELLKFEKAENSPNY
ncbi:DUF4269 domain-containing protein [Dyadobacter tibetensis]|uniref:DUF4269 domain-containing protein n=1 Tax=Dyadobacter tibetensis TaxID=1211851 RepID=UPI0004726B48|nr:DUF4269 domain-containing protein [Dyadobacter tibetensis]